MSTETDYATNALEGLVATAPPEGKGNRITIDARWEVVKQQTPQQSIQLHSFKSRGLAMKMARALVEDGCGVRVFECSPGDIRLSQNPEEAIFNEGWIDDWEEFLDKKKSS